ncbi:LOW QUALITY PROTEIN: hypothetical protein V2J09_019324 [Rumex salicifolius]
MGSSELYRIYKGGLGFASQLPAEYIRGCSISTRDTIGTHSSTINMALSLRAIDIKHFSIAIFFSLLLCKLVASDSMMLSTCKSNYTETISNETGLVDDKYKVNRQTVLNNLISTSTSTSLSFYNTTAGESPYKSHAIYLCRGDTTPYLCGSCVTNLTEWVISNSGNCTESLAYSDHCMLHYANHSFLGTVDNSSLGFSYDKYEEKISGVYNRTLEGIIEQVIREAAYNSTSLFATSEAAVDQEDEKVYALAECTPDIDRGSCSGCLKTAQSDLQHIPGDAKYAWVMLTSCQLRYDNTSFFEVSSAEPPISAVVVAILSLLTYARGRRLGRDMNEMEPPHTTTPPSLPTEHTPAPTTDPPIPLQTPLPTPALPRRTSRPTKQSTILRDFHIAATLPSRSSNPSSSSHNVLSGLPFPLEQSVFTSAASSDIFRNITVGEPPSKSYGIYLCRGDTAKSLCGGCVSVLTYLAMSNSTNCTENFVYTDDCIIHYANHSLRTADYRLQGKLYDKVNLKNSLEYNQTLWLRKEAAYKNANLFAISEAAVKHDGEKVNLYAQCTPDVDGDSCNGCLKAAQSHLQHDISGGAKFAWANLTRPPRIGRHSRAVIYIKKYFN